MYNNGVFSVCEECVALFRTTSDTARLSDAQLIAALIVACDLFPHRVPVFHCAIRDRGQEVIAKFDRTAASVIRDGVAPPVLILVHAHLTGREPYSAV